MLNPDSIHQRLTELGDQWANMNAAAEILEENKKTLISQLSCECDDKSMSAKESYAFRHPDYIQHVKEMVCARKEANRSKVNYDNAKIWAELKRTEAANERAANRSAT